MSARSTAVEDRAAARDAEALRSEHGLAGLAIAMVQTESERILCAGECATGGEPIGPDTVFRIASLTKTMTAIGVMQLRDEGRLALDDHVNDYLKGLRIDHRARRK
jgi:CubicO group peptidase (beta-lactamase class C family)